MVLPAIEKTTVLVVRFSPSISDRLIDLVENRFRDGGLVILSKKVVDGGKVLLQITTTQSMLEKTAEMIHLMKQTVDSQTIEYFTVKDRLRFSERAKQQHRHHWSGHGVVVSESQQNKNYPQLDHRDEPGIFTSHEWALLIRRILDNITVLRKNEFSSELSEILDKTYRADYHVHLLQETTLTTTMERRLFGDNYINANTGRQSLRKKLREHGEQSVCLRHVLETYNIIDKVDVVHLPRHREDILHKIWWPWYQIEPPVKEIYSYYGWEVSFYFAWMGFLTRWLIFPGVLGVICVLQRWYRKDTLDEDEFTPFYGLITFLWGVMFLRFWERNENRLAYQWGVYSLSEYERQKYFETRPEFFGFLRRSPVTGLVETYYPPLRRRLKYVVSALATAIMLGIAFWVMILSLNLQGYIHPHTKVVRWQSSADLTRDNPSSPIPTAHPFHVRSLAVYSEPGQIFDAQSSWRGMIPVIFHSICIFILNRVYRVIAEALTSWENHETILNHSNSVILKRFLFEAFDCYVALLYLAFYERDVDRLRLELVAAFQVDTFRRIIFECLLPMLLQKKWFVHTYAGNHNSSDTMMFSEAQESASSNKKTTNPKENVAPYPPPRFALRMQRLSQLWVSPTDATVLDDLDKDEYESFDDYMEIVIQLGYVTLFASAYPLASWISIVANMIEIRSDGFKMARLCRRPHPTRCSGLGMWNTLVSCVIWASAFTNCMIAGFTSNQLIRYMPNLYVRDESSMDYSIEHDDGWMVVFVIFGLERILLLMGLLIHAIVPAVPEDVVTEMERWHYVRSLAKDAEEEAERVSKATTNSSSFPNQGGNKKTD